MDKMVKELLFNFYNGKKVLLTGHTGFKGSWMSILLDLLGADLYGYALPPNTQPNLYTIAGVDEIIDSTLGDIRDLETLSNTIEKVRPEIIIHLAAQPLVQESYKNPKETYEINVMGTVNLLEVVRRVSGIKAVLNVTTDKCYENKEWYWAYRENEPLGGFDPYSNSKACSELVTSAYRNSFFNFMNSGSNKVCLASARAGNVLGGGDWASDRLIPDFIRAISQNNRIKIRNPASIRPWQHVMEPLTGYLLLCRQMFLNGPLFSEGFNFGPEETDCRNVEWLVKRICELWGNDAEYEIDERTYAHESTYLKLDCSKAKRMLEWSPSWNLDKSISMVVKWYKNYFDEKDMRTVTIQQIEEYYNS